MAAGLALCILGRHRAHRPRPEGPLILAPLVILCAWLVMAGRWRDLWRTHPIFGLPLAMVPLAIVAYLYWQANPERTARIWRFEFIDRITGEGGHNDPLGVACRSSLAASSRPAP